MSIRICQLSNTFCPRLRSTMQYIMPLSLPQNNKIHTQSLYYYYPYQERTIHTFIMFTNAEHVLEPGSLILVTGTTGFIGSHISDKLLEAGYRVRGLTRDADKNAWIAEVFQAKYGDKFTLITADLTEPLDALLKDVSGVIHCASDMSYDADPNAVITPTIAIALQIFKAAVSTPSVERFVFTSSCAAAAMPGSAPYPTITGNTWNEEAIRQAWAPAPYESSRGFAVYAASKAQTEKALWDAYKETPGDLIFNTVLPAGNFGRALDPRQGHPSTSGLVQALFMNDTATASNGPQYFYVDVEDTARLHVAALLHPSIRDERIFAYAAPYTWRGMQDILRELYPERDFVEVPEASLDESVIVQREVAEGYLQMMGRDGWTGLKDCVRMNTEHLS
ncbi:hypothetical protein VHEMI08768 [[Torrubiella] hemipterigena]|uniref:NAD-dependent epimerase/dehydratase domain-containing protein n=1 Tax=[Torrubiella] hemipterigena TaxID=1531966 RepID=A0A0A1TP61_9HYPO|nr:hypothetical protein VHEMI08768 [[Torrubiella] hemipterigena]